MKFSKRLLCTMLVAVFTLVNVAVMPTFAAFTDLTTENNAYEAVNVLNKLGVINGYDDGSFKPDNNVTRAEFTAMLLRTRGMGNVGSTSLENPPFPDVTTSDVSWAIGNIRTAREMNIINGYDDGTFKPNNNVLYEEAVKMIVCALGYGEMGAEGAFWYSRYLMTATSLGFTEGSGGAIGAPATRATIAKMLYNCLEVKLAENNEITSKTILENDLNLTKNIGYIASNPEISLSVPDANLRDDEIQITAPNAQNVDETHTYKAADVSKYADMLGAQITFYYKDDAATGFKNLIYANVKNNSTTLTLNAEMIDGCTASAITYYTSEDASTVTTASVAADSVVVYNGKLYGATDRDSRFSDYSSEPNAMPTIGNVKLLDGDGDKIYDVVFIESYDTYVVSTVASSSYTITDKVLREGLADADKKIILNPKDDNITTTFVDAKGNASSFSSIKKNSVVHVKTSNALNGGKVIRTVVVCNDSVSGTISATSTKEGVTINSKTYKFSVQAPWENPITGATPTLTTAPQRGDAGTFYLDMDGRIIAYDKTATASNQQYGYIMDADLSNDNFEESLRLYIMTQSGSKNLYTVDSDSKLNGVDAKTLGGLQSYLDTLDNTAMPGGSSNYPNSSNDDYSQLVKFTVRKGTIIDDIIPAAPVSSGQTIDTDTLYYYDGIEVADSAKWNSTQKQFKFGSETIYAGSAILISVPENKGNDKKYKVMKFSDLSNNTDYNAEFYDVSGSSTSPSAKVILVYGGATAVGEVKADSPVFLITDIEYAENTVINGYENGSTKSYTLSSEDSDTVSIASTLQEGDVVRLGTDDDGLATIKREHVIFSLADSFTSSGKAYGPEDNSSGNLAYQAFWGSVYSIDDEGDNQRLIISTSVLSGTETDASFTTFDIQKSWYNNAKIYLLTKSEIGNKSKFITEVTKDEIEGLQQYNGTDRPAEIFIHRSGSTSIKTILIIKR